MQPCKNGKYDWRVAQWVCEDIDLGDNTVGEDEHRESGQVDNEHREIGQVDTDCEYVAGEVESVDDDIPLSVGEGVAEQSSDLASTGQLRDT